MTPNAPAPPKGSKDAILRRIREALQEPAPLRHLASHHHHSPANLAPHSQQGTHPDTTSGPRPRDPEKWLPPVPEDPAGQLELFCRLSKDLKTNVILCSSPEAASRELAALAREEAWRTIFTHRGTLTQAICPHLEDAGVSLRSTDSGYEKDDLEAADAGITECEALVAQTGSILVSSSSSGGRVLSVLVPHHIVLATTSQITRDLAAALRRLRQNHDNLLPRWFSFITGPSRTGDIERILVLGAHGPKRLTVLLVNDAAATASEPAQDAAGSHKR